MAVFSALGADGAGAAGPRRGRHPALPGEYAAQEGASARSSRCSRGASRRCRSSTGSSASSACASRGRSSARCRSRSARCSRSGSARRRRSRVMRLEPHDYHAVAAAAPEVAQGGRPARGPPDRRARRGCRASRPSRRRRARSSSGTGGTPPCTELRLFLDRNQITFRWVTPDAPDADEQWGGPLPAEDDWPAIRVVDGKTVVRPQLRQVAELLGLATEADGAEYDIGDRRRRPRRAGRGGLRRVGGAADDRDRARGARRPGRHVVADRELPRLPVGRVRRRAREPRAPAGAEARRRDPRHPDDHPHRHRHARGAPRRRRRPPRARDHPRLRRRVAAARDRGLRPARREGRLVRRVAQRGAEHARPRRPHRGRRQLGRAGGDLLLDPRPERDDPLPRRRAGEEHVALPDRPARAAAEHRARYRSEVVAAHGDASLEAIEVRNSATGETTRLDSGGLYIFIGADAETAWLPPEIALDDRTASCSPAPRCAPTGAGRSTATRTCSRRASRASSRAATSASAR